MKTLRALRVSARGLFSHKVRAVLAISSVAAGVAAVIVTGAVGEATRQQVLRETDRLGTNLLAVRSVQVRHSAARKELQGEVTSLKLDDYEAITRLSRVSAATPGFQSSKISVKASKHALATDVIGVTSDYMEICHFRLAEGRFLDGEDDLSTWRVAVLGARAKDILFGKQNAIGQQIRVREIPFEVIGVFQAKGILADGDDEDNQIVIPIRTAMRRVFNYRWINKIFVRVGNISDMDTVRMEVTELLRDRHRLMRGDKPDDFEIQDKTQVLGRRKQLARSLTILATALAAASLVVGGAGILALMLMSVKERTTEIGLRMAVGAKSRDILIQFLLEAACVAASGWLAGMALGTIGTIILTKTTTLETSISPELVLSTIAVMALNALGFGAYPARKASLIPPIAALRME